MSSLSDNGAHVPQLRPFFGYYGGKWRDALKHYPEPEHDTIVEPFAGSAGYSLRYAHRKIILCEIDPVLSEVWRYLIRVKAKEILAIPDLDPEGTVDDIKLPQEAKWLVGFWLNRGAASPRKSPSKWMREGIRPGSFWGPRVRQTIASQVDSIRHWQILNCSYADCPTPRTATWFVDPPYEAAGRHYRFGSEQMDYEALAAWCRSRPGQVIVCENEGATWLPFRELADVKTTRADRRSKEVIWLSTQEQRRALRSATTENGLVDAATGNWLSTVDAATGKATQVAVATWMVNTPPEPHDPGAPHLIDGEFQSDKYPTTPRGKVPLSCKDPTAQDLLWEYAQRRRAVDAEFAADLETALRNVGYVPDAFNFAAWTQDIRERATAALVANVEQRTVEAIAAYFAAKADKFQRIAAMTTGYNAGAVDMCREAARAVRVGDWRPPAEPKEGE